MHVPITSIPRFATTAGLAVLLSALIGCGNSDGLAPVSGTVTLDGQPLTGALVSFYPADGGRPSHGKTDASGNYDLAYSDEKSGAKSGTNTIRITIAPMEGEGESETAAPGPRLPARYNEQSELTADVPSGGSSNLDFALTSD